MTDFSPTRRGLLFCIGAVVVGSTYGAWVYTHPQPANGTRVLSVQEAHRAALEGRILLIDIRRPDEWARTGIGVGALPLDMRRPDFIAALDRIAAGDPTRAVALICARGVRSARLTNRLAQAGFTNTIDVPEGMQGSGAGPGWLAKGLPVLAAP